MMINRSHNMRYGNQSGPCRAQVRCAPAGFTLTELLVAIGIITMLTVLTAVSFRVVTNDAKLSMGKNTVMAVLDNARALAMKNNKIVMVAFRAVPDGENEQYIEAVLAEWTGESYRDPGVGVVDRFRPIVGTPVRSLPRGIQIASPQYGGNYDDYWQSCSHLPGVVTGEQAGGVIAVVFNPDGVTITRNTRSDSDRMFVDFNDDYLQRQGGNDFDLWSTFPNNNGYCDFGNNLPQFFCQREPDDEPYVTIAPYLAVYNDVEARELYDTTTWSNGQTRADDVTRYVTNNADRIHFNRYTGVAMK